MIHHNPPGLKALFPAHHVQKFHSQPTIRPIMLNPITTSKATPSAPFSLVAWLMKLPTLLLDPVLLSSQICVVSLFPRAPLHGRARMQQRASSRKGTCSRGGWIVGEGKQQWGVAWGRRRRKCGRQLFFFLPSRAQELSFSACTFFSHASSRTQPSKRRLLLHGVAKAAPYSPTARWPRRPSSACIWTPKRRLSNALKTQHSNIRLLIFLKVNNQSWRRLISTFYWTTKRMST
jgi:hypothetical protein